MNGVHAGRRRKWRAAGLRRRARWRGRGRCRKLPERTRARRSRPRPADARCSSPSPARGRSRRAHPPTRPQPRASSAITGVHHGARHAGADARRRAARAPQRQARTRRSPRRVPRRRRRVLPASWARGCSATNHVGSVGSKIDRFFARDRHGRSSTPALLWLTYLGLEPYVRRFSPDSLIGWTRLVAGSWRDPRVGRDVMIGVAAGLAMTRRLRRCTTCCRRSSASPEPMPVDVGSDGS